MKDPRIMAARLLIDMEASRLTLDTLLDRYAPMLEGLQSRDRALFHNLVYGVLRHKGRLDWILSAFSRKSLNRLNAGVLAALRLGLFQLLYLDRIPPSAAVNTAVETAKHLAGKWTGSFVNAVLRNVLRRADQTSWPDKNSQPAKYLAVVYSMPSWIVERWLDRFGLWQTENLCRTVNQVPDVVLRANRNKCSPSRLIETLGKDVRRISACRISPDGVRLQGLGKPVNRLAGFDKGWFQVQGEASQLVVWMLKLEPGLKVWDACAGLGTKACQMATLMQDRGSILATDKHSHRLAAINGETARLGLTCISSNVIDLTKVSKKRFQADFDRILIDAPCSALGVIRKNPDVKWTANQDRLFANSRRQLQMLNKAAGFLRPGGIMVYAVCSFEPEETTDVIRQFLKTRSDFDIDRPLKFRWLENNLTPAGFLLTLPHKDGISGFFAAALKRRA